MEQKRTSLDTIYRRVLQLYEVYRMPLPRICGIGFEKKWTSVRTEEGAVGRAFNFTADHVVYGAIDPGPLTAYQDTVGRPVGELVERIKGQEDILHRSLFLAAVNALSGPLNREERLVSAGFSVKGPGDLSFIHPGDKVVIIGAGAYMEEVRDICGHVDVIDMRPAFALQSLYIEGTIRREPAGIFFHGPEATGELLQRAEVVLATGCTLVNGTFDRLREQAADCRVFALFGPSAQPAAEYLKDRGVHYALTSRVEDHGQKVTGYTIKL